MRVLTEGHVTEPSYLARWARHNRDVRLDLAESGMVPLTLVETAREHQRSNRSAQRRGFGADFDEIWCVFDVDAHPNLIQALTEARDSDINTAVSNPCFELWLVLHIRDQTAHTDRRTIQRVAKDLGLVDGKAVSIPALERLASTYEEAKDRAIALDQRHRGNGSPAGSNPSTRMWRLVDRLR